MSLGHSVADIGGEIAGPLSSLEGRALSGFLRQFKEMGASRMAVAKGAFN